MTAVGLRLSNCVISRPKPLPPSILETPPDVWFFRAAPHERQHQQALVP